MGQNSSMGQFTGVSLKLLPLKFFIFNDIDDSDWPMAKSVNISRGVIMRVRHSLSRTKWLPVQRKRRRSPDIGINSKRNGLRSSPSLSVAREILKRLAVCSVAQTLELGTVGEAM